MVNRRIVRDFIVEEALPLLPSPPIGPARLRLVEAPGPCAVVALLEREFAIASDQAQLTLLCDTRTMLGYLGWVALAEHLRPLEGPGETEQQFMLYLNSLLPMEDATSEAAQPIWALDRFKELRALLSGMEPSENTRCRDRLAERLAALLPGLPSGPLTDATPAALIEAVECDLALSSRLESPLIEPSSASCYRKWLAHALQTRAALRAAAERSAIGAAAYRDEAGIPLIPPADLDLDVVPEGVKIAWEQAQRDGRWQLSFSFFAFLMPAFALEILGLRGWGVPIAVIETPSLIHLANSRAPPDSLAIFFAIVLIVHLILAFTMRRLVVRAAVGRVKRADRLRVVTREERKRIIAYESFTRADRPRGVTREERKRIIAYESFSTIGLVLTFFATLTFMIISYPIWHEAKFPVQTSLNDWVALGQADLKNGRVKPAIYSFTGAIAKGNAAAPAYQGRADAYMADSRPERAIADYDQAIALDPENIDTHLHRIDAAFRLRRGDLAVSDYEAVERLDPFCGRQRNLRVWERGVSLWLEHDQRYLPQGRLRIDVATIDPADRKTLDRLPTLRPPAITSLPMSPERTSANRSFRCPNDGYALTGRGTSVVVAFVDHTGHIVARTLETSSGDAGLDDAALKTFSRAAPLPVPPRFSAGTDAKEMLGIRALFRIAPP